MLRPIYVFELDKEGNRKLDKHGEPVMHKRYGEPKDLKDYTVAEKADREDQLRRLEDQKHRDAQAGMQLARELTAALEAVRGSATAR